MFTTTFPLTLIFVHSQWQAEALPLLASRRWGVEPVPMTAEKGGILHLFLFRCVTHTQVMQCPPSAAFEPLLEKQTACKETIHGKSRNVKKNLRHCPINVQKNLKFLAFIAIIVWIPDVRGVRCIRTPSSHLPHFRELKSINSIQSRKDLLILPVWTNFIGNLTARDAQRRRTVTERGTSRKSALYCRFWEPEYQH